LRNQTGNPRLERERTRKIWRRFGAKENEIKKPEQRHIDALRIINENGGRISKKEMAKLAVDNKLIVVNAENESQATFASLDKGIINALENQWKFVKVEKIGRTRWINITEDGKNAAEFLI